MTEKTRPDNKSSVILPPSQHSPNPDIKSDHRRRGPSMRWQRRRQVLTLLRQEYCEKHRQWALIRDVAGQTRRPKGL